MKWNLVWLVLFVVMNSCITPPNEGADPSQYYTSYFLFYDGVTQKSTAAVIFTGNDDNGFRQELTGVAKVEFNGEQMPLNEDFLEYNLEKEGFIPEGQFTYTDINGFTFVNEVGQKLVDFRAGLDSVAITADWDFVWNGDPLEKGELMSLEIYDESGDFGEVFNQFEEGATKITIPKVGLAKQGTGLKKFTVTREKVIDTDNDPGVGGQIHNQYKTSKEVVLYN